MPEKEISRTKIYDILVRFVNSCPDKKFLGSIMLIGSFLFFWNLGDQYLKLDEGLTAMLGKNILQFGFPTIWDGKNLIGEPDFTINNIWAQHSWLSFYLVALSCFFFGNTSFAALFPFALSGFITIPILYMFSFRISRSTSIARFATVFYTFSVPCLLYSRTARYISLPFPLVLLMMNYYLDILENKHRSGIKFVAASTILFHSMYIQFASAFIGVVIHFFIFVRNKKTLRKFIALSLVIAVFTMPWFFYYPVAALQNIRPHLSELIGQEYSINLLWIIKSYVAYFAQINSYIFPLVLLLFIPVLYKKSDIMNENVSYYALPLIVICSIIFVATIQVIPLQNYIVGALPLVYLFLANFCRQVKKINVRIAYVLSFLLITTNLFHATPWFLLIGLDKITNETVGRELTKTELGKRYRNQIKNNAVLRFSLYDYLYELTHRYNGPIGATVSYLKQYGSPKDSFVMGHESNALIFYTDMKRVVIIPFVEPPDWIIPRHNSSFGISNTRERTKEEANSYVWNYLKENNYEKIVLDAPNVRSENTYDIQIHKFRTPVTDRKVTVYHYSKKSL